MASSHQPKDFDVFLSFRGEDTRRGFVSHLYKALDQHGIRTFIDDNLHRGENISEELLQTIENSSASIVVFSKNYASSSWCLDELAKIIECTQKVLPVFYQVDPSEVRKLKGDFGEVLTKLEKRIKDKTKVQRWREALTNAANISGWDYKDSCTESELVEKIVEDILNSEFIQIPSNDATVQLVGINSRVEAVAKLIDIESNDVRMVGITGLGGIGKTTIAKAIYDSFSNHFKAKSFVENVREWSKTEQGKIHLQEALLKGISEDKNLRVSTINEGTTRINRILRLKRVLIILDDVDNADQIDTLLGQWEGFAFGSRIILTTRDKSLLVQNGLSTYDYGVKELDEDEAIELFRKHAFPSNQVPEDYLELEKQAISYAKGLPLALKVMGRDLCGKTIHEWDDALDCYKTNPHEDIQNILKRSYEGLTANEQNIFLDIACFFKGYNMNYNMIKDVLKACGLNPEYGIRRLINKCLLTTDQDNYNLSMHDLLQQMGMDIVRQEAPQKPGERSRLWCYEEALDVLTEDMGSNKIQSMILWPPKSQPVEVHIKEQFCKMKNLRLLLIRNVRCCNGPLEYLPNGLSLLDWREYPFSSWPPNFFPKKLVALNMPSILLKEPLRQNFVSVTCVDFSECSLITKIPDLSIIPNVTDLKLSYCRNLVEIDDSVGRLDKLKVWDLCGCEKLETLPNCLTMKSLTYFNLKECERIKKFPNILHEMEGVKDLYLPGNCTNELPPSFGNLIGLKGLTVGSPDSGEAHLPDSIYNLQHIEMLEFFGDVIFPKNVEIDRQPMCNSLGCSCKYVFPRLKRLHLYCFNICSEIEFILNYCCPLTLEELEIQYSKVVTLPESMSRCQRLHTLIIRDCNEFQEIQRLPHSIRRVDVAYCPSLDSQSFFQLVPEIIGLPPNLPPCSGVTSHMLMFPHSSTMLPIWQNPRCEYSFEVTGDENDIPNWFNHQRDGNSISFSIGPEFPTIALCVAFGIQDSSLPFDYHAFISINGSERKFEKDRITRHLSFCCRPQSSLQQLFRDFQLNDRNHVEILCEIFPHSLSKEIAPPIVTRIGVHVECNCLSLQSGLGLPMDTENGSDLGLEFDSSNVDGFDLGSSSVAQSVTPQVKKRKRPEK
ncbi:TMV resistance protein N-like [Quercus lobata]|uniref:TIR domain-containing protein n=1 Tax=Quercus lobata TaxID=97700 RepID=A0A7N2LB26_QUELO|nr:TMV resistance protein N-like [Quercus lobata]XP_030966145.1 TMV resistance protein N-like [Quercus lobata]XP_030966147.1 TMV resistance protein N-like [Quercus lobata]XP_030966148.1 TMV resistance protein N-like [Quercus lobata]XP_030966149.1 TMV resistance protein N-like [Quercus lobata]XP_030966150.1 TMV resistance protein N-like [Quercus lobata]